MHELRLFGAVVLLSCLETEAGRCRSFPRFSLEPGLFECVQGRVVHKGPLVLTAADAFLLKAVVAGERERERLCLVREPPLSACLSHIDPRTLMFQSFSQPFPEQSEQNAASINVILQGPLAQDFSRSVNQGVRARRTSRSLG